MRIIIESGSDLTLEEIENHQLDFLPMGVTIDQKSFRDQYDISNKQIYSAIENGKRPMTSQPSIEEMEQLFVNIAQNKEEAIYYAFSSALSGTYQSAVMVLAQVRERYPDVQIDIVDSQSASRGLGMQILELVRLRNEGASKQDMLNFLLHSKAAIRHLFTVDDLNYLAKGGRLSRGQAFLGSIINVKPLLTVENGQLVPKSKFRGRKKVFHEMVEIIKEECPDLTSAQFEIAHSNAEQDAQQLASMLESHNPSSVTIHEIGPTISSHTGQGTIALFYYKEV